MKLIEIPAEAIEKFLKWNKPPFNFSELLDKKMVFALLFICFDKDQIVDGLIPEGVKEFIEGTCAFNFLFTY